MFSKKLFCEIENKRVTITKETEGTLPNGNGPDKVFTRLSCNPGCSRIWTCKYTNRKSNINKI